MGKQSVAEHYLENARHDVKTGEGSKADLAYDLKKGSEYGYLNHKKPHAIHKHMKH